MGTILKLNVGSCAGRFFLFGFLFFCLAPLQAQAAPANLLTNGGMEAAGAAGTPAGWEPLWTRDVGAGMSGMDTATTHGGINSLRVVHHGADDWSVAQSKPVPVQPGDILTLGGWVKFTGTGDAQLSVVVRAADGTVLNWMAGLTSTGNAPAWTHLTRRLAVPAGGATAQFRFTGNGLGTAWLDDASLVREAAPKAAANAAAGQTLHLTNHQLEIGISATDGTVTVKDKRSGAIWKQGASGADLVVLKAVPLSRTAVQLSLRDLLDDLRMTATLTLDPLRPELTVRLAAQGSFQEAISYPAAFVTAPKTWLIVPMNEGILFPVDDASIPPMTLVAYSGHGLCMPWYGATDPKTGAGVMTILRTPDDARVSITRRLGTGLFLQPEWEPSRGAFGYERALTYVFFAQGGYVAQAKRYRQYAQATGLFKTLAQKKRENPAVDKLVGAVNVWNWDPDKLGLCREMKAAGMSRVLWSGGGSPEEIAQINALGYLTSRYDIYQDVFPPDSPARLRHIGWPEDLVQLPGGEMAKGWADKQKNADGTEKIWQGGVINSQRGLAHAKEEIPRDLKTTPYGCRFIDTTTASPWREDYNPAHPLTRTQDRFYKMALLKFCAQELKLVVGTETGIDPSVPYADYYEGMLSLGPYRLPDSGYEMMGYRTPTPDFLKFQVGHFYRIPLWELVYHECVVAQWYWGDATNKSPEVWPQRDLFNTLYATPPLFFFDSARWKKDKAHFVQSYQAVCPLVRKLGYDEMRSHEFLTPDHAVQRTRWLSGTEIVVNFGSEPYRLMDGRVVAPHGSAVR